MARNNAVRNLMIKAREQKGYDYIEFYYIVDPNYPAFLRSQINCDRVYISDLADLYQMLDGLPLDESANWARCEVLNEGEYNEEFQENYETGGGTLILVLNRW